MSAQFLLVSLSLHHVSHQPRVIRLWWPGFSLVQIFLCGLPRIILEGYPWLK